MQTIHWWCLSHALTDCPASLHSLQCSSAACRCPRYAACLLSRRLIWAASQTPGASVVRPKFSTFERDFCSFPFIHSFSLCPLFWAGCLVLTVTFYKIPSACDVLLQVIELQLEEVHLDLCDCLKLRRCMQTGCVPPKWVCASSLLSGLPHERLVCLKDRSSAKAQRAQFSLGCWGWLIFLLERFSLLDCAARSVRLQKAWCRWTRVRAHTWEC